jgi:hypothetical protein
VRAIIAPLDVTAERSSATYLYGRHDAPLGEAQMAYGQKTKTAAKMAVVQASTMKQLSAPFPKAPHGSA